MQIYLVGLRKRKQEKIAIFGHFVVMDESGKSVFFKEPLGEASTEKEALGLAVRRCMKIKDGNLSESSWEAIRKANL